MALYFGKSKQLKVLNRDEYSESYEEFGVVKFAGDRA